MDSDIPLSSDSSSGTAADAPETCHSSTEDCCPGWNALSAEHRLLLCAGKLARRYEASLAGAPASIAATVFARHRHDLADIIAALAAAIDPQGASWQPIEVASAAGSIWQNADAFLDHLGRLRYLHGHADRLLAIDKDGQRAGGQQTNIPPSDERCEASAGRAGTVLDADFVTKLSDTMRLHLWSLAQLDADLRAKREAFPFCSEALLSGMALANTGQIMAVEGLVGQGLANQGSLAGPSADRFQVDITVSAAPSSKGGLSAWQLRRIDSLIDAAPGESMTVSVLAQYVGLSPSHFARAFKLSRGTSPARWLLLKRLELAKALLIETDQPLAEIAAACGFLEPSHFTKRFRQVVGVTPGVWRRLQK